MDIAWIIVFVLLGLGIGGVVWVFLSTQKDPEVEEGINKGAIKRAELEKVGKEIVDAKALIKIMTQVLEKTELSKTNEREELIREITKQNGNLANFEAQYSLLMEQYLSQIADTYWVYRESKKK